jgi:hypothetical protein
MRAVTTVLFALVLTIDIPSSAAERVRHVVESVLLANYGGDWYTVPTSINNLDEIAGWAVRGDDWVAFTRTRRGRYEAIVDRAFTRDINDRGEIVGVLFPCDGDDCRIEGFIWSRERGLHNLGSFLPFAVNNHGDMAGVCDPPRQACIMRDGVVTMIAVPGSEARGINGRGDVVGVYGDNRAFHLTADWQFKDIGRAVAEDINDRRTIAGHQWTVFGARGERAMVTAWTAHGARSPLREVSLGAAINNRGWVIANAFDENETSYSFIWDPKTDARVMLDGPAGGSVQLEDVNDRGNVVGTAGMRAVIWQVRRKQLIPVRQ